MTWFAFISIIESKYDFTRELVWIEAERLRLLLVRSYTEGFAEGQKRGSKGVDTHHLFKFLRGELDADADARGTDALPLPALKGRWEPKEKEK